MATPPNTSVIGYGTPMTLASTARAAVPTSRPNTMSSRCSTRPRVASVVTLTLYGKPGCHLCDDARAEIERIRGEHPFALEQIDITLDPALNRRYGERIPVLALDGDELFELRIDGDALRERLDRVDV